MNDYVDVLNSQWAKRECAAFDGIVFADGTRIPIEFERDMQSGWAPTFLIGNRMWDKSWVIEIGDEISSLDSLCRIQLPGGCIAECGEGSSGGDGYIAVTAYDGKLVWLLFFESANPFTQLELKGSHLVAINSYSEIWDIPITSPEQLRIAPAV